MEQYRIASLHLSIQDWHDHPFWKSLRWKLDSFRTDSDMPPDITFRRCAEELPAVPQLNATPVSVVKSGFFRWEVYALPDGSTVWQYVRISQGVVYLQYLVSADKSCVTLLQDRTDTDGIAAFELAAVILPTLLLTHDILTLHGVLMEHEGKGILISADSGVGKTTHARLWRDHKNALILNGDRASCRRENGVWTGYGLPWSGTSGEQICRSVPISALVILERGEENEAHRITGMESFGAAWPHVQKPVWDEALTGRALELTDDFLSSIPVIRLSCRPDPDSVDVLFRALENL